METPPQSRQKCTNRIMFCNLTKQGSPEVRGDGEEFSDLLGKLSRGHHLKPCDLIGVTPLPSYNPIPPPSTSHNDLLALCACWVATRNVMLLFSTTCLVRHTVYETPFHGLVALPAFAKAETKVQLSFETSQKSHGQQMVAGTASSLGPSV